MTDIIDELSTYGADVEIYDPWADSQEAQQYYGVTMTETLEENRHDAVVLAVAHQEFSRFDQDELKRITRSCAVIYDVKNVLAKGLADGNL